MRRYRIALGLLVLAVVASGSVVFVDESELAVLTQFGRPVREIREPGPCWKPFWQSTTRIDRRLRTYDPPPSEFLTRDKKNIDLDVFVLWRVDEPTRYLETAGHVLRAEARLHDLVWSRLAAVVGRSDLDSLVSMDPEASRLDDRVAEVAETLRPLVREDLGVRLVDVEIERVALPEQVRESVFRRMRAERARIARQYRAEGEEEALKIRAGADKERTIALARAESEAEVLRGEAEAEATRIYARAHGQDPEFYRLLRTLEAYRRILGERTTLLLSADSPLLEHLIRSLPTREPDGGIGAATSTASRHPDPESGHARDVPTPRS